MYLTNKRDIDFNKYCFNISAKQTTKYKYNKQIINIQLNVKSRIHCHNFLSPTVSVSVSKSNIKHFSSEIY